MAIRMKSTRLLVLMFALIVLFTWLTGCGKTNTDSSTGLSENSSGSGSYSQQADSNIAMGRYVEKITDFDADRISGYGSSLYRLSDGRIVISDINKPFLISDDNG